jgi:hypothetical protein
MTNVKLSKEELALVTDADLILTKNRIIQKVYDLFGDLSEDFKIAGSSLDPEILSVPPKISRGEHYLGLPWVMLDYPRKFSQTDVFGIRSFFWWGNFFSITLQLQGKYQQLYAASIEKQMVNEKDWWLGNGDDAWQHHFEPGNYRGYTGEYSLQRLPFVKLAKKIPLQEWDNAFDFYRSSFRQIINLLST